MKQEEGVSYYSRGGTDPYGLFLPNQVGRGRGLNPAKMYCAMRFPTKGIKASEVRSSLVFVRKTSGGPVIECHPADWGPAEWTLRGIDLSPAAAGALGVATDDVVELVWMPAGHTDLTQIW